MKIALVTWIDSYLYSDQVNYDHDFACAEIKTSGFLVEQDEEKVVITQMELGKISAQHFDDFLKFVQGEANF